MNTKSTEERVSALESCAFQTGRDLAEIKSVQREHTDRLATLDERMMRLEHGVGLLLDHYGIEQPRA